MDRLSLPSLSLALVHRDDKNVFLKKALKFFSGIHTPQVSKSKDKGACLLTSRNAMVPNEREDRGETNGSRTPPHNKVYRGTTLNNTAWGILQNAKN